jgi:hypothetical protein
MTGDLESSFSNDSTALKDFTFVPRPAESKIAMGFYRLFFTGLDTLMLSNSLA